MKVLIETTSGEVLKTNLQNMSLNNQIIKLWDIYGQMHVFACDDIKTLQISQNEATEGMSLKDAIEHFNLNMKEASELLGVPYRTFQNWCTGLRKCPDYIERMMVKELFERM